MHHETNNFKQSDELFEDVEKMIMNGSIDQAMPLLKQVTDLNQHFKYAQLLMSRLLYRKGRIQDSLKMAERCFTEDPQYPEAALMIARCYFDTDRIQDAIDVLGKCRKSKLALRALEILKNQNYKKTRD